MLVENCVNSVNKVAYFQDREHEVLGAVSEYHMFVGGRLVFKIYVQTEDDKQLTDHENCFPIWAARYNGEGAIPLEGACAFKKYSKTLGRDRVSSTAVQAVTYTFLAFILTELYVPTEAGD